MIDFFAADIDYEKAFAGPGRASTTLSSASIEKATGAATTLPADIHYDISELSKLFLKPNWAIRLPGSRSTTTRKDGANEFLSGVVEVNFRLLFKISFLSFFSFLSPTYLVRELTINSGTQLHSW